MSFNLQCIIVFERFFLLGICEQGELKSEPAW